MKFEKPEIEFEIAVILSVFLFLVHLVSIWCFYVLSIHGFDGVIKGIILFFTSPVFAIILTAMDGIFIMTLPFLVFDVQMRY